MNVKEYLHISKEEVHAMNQTFSDAMHETSSRVTEFKRANWRKFFLLLAKNWKIPSSNAINIDLLD